MKNSSSPVLLWLRRDLRLDDHPALCAAVADGAPLIPVFIRDAHFDQLGAAAKWRFGLGLSSFDQKLRAQNSALTLRSGEPLEVLSTLAYETGAKQVIWSRSYDPKTLARDIELKARLEELGLNPKSHEGFLLCEPWSIKTKTGTPFRVYTPFWRNLRSAGVPAPIGAPADLSPPRQFPQSEDLADWHLDKEMNRGAAIVSQHVNVGEDAALARLDHFLHAALSDYRDKRDYPALPATSGLSEHLTYGEISPRRIWHRAMITNEINALTDEHFLKELVWRDFAWHLYWHDPNLPDQSWNPKWQGFPWRHDKAALAAWQRGQTGVALVDAGMRELHVTGKMHNRVRMIAASYLSKHLMIDWREGERFFASHLVDFDPASNAMGWQWVAGSGPDAAPYFRIFNPERQAKLFDPKGLYVDRYLGDGPEAQAFFAAVPKRWNLSANAKSPEMIEPLAKGRNRALETYAAAFPKSQ